MTESKSLVKVSNTQKISTYLLRIGLLGSLVSLFLRATVFGATFGTAFFTGLGLYLAFLGLVLKPYKNKRLSQVMGYAKIAFITVTAIWLISFIIIEGFVFSAIRQDLVGNPKYVVILGAGLKGNMPTQSLARRLITGVRYLKGHPEVMVVVSGGQGAGENTTEAQVMDRYLIEHGIARERIIEETESSNTFENLANTKEILDRREGSGPHKIMIITSDYHLFRAKMLASRVGLIPNGIPARMPFLVRINYAVREYFAVVKSYFVDK